MAKSSYQIVNDFQVADYRVLELDTDYEFGHFAKAVIDGEEYSYTLNSVRNWVVIRSNESFSGRTVIFAS